MFDDDKPPRWQKIFSPIVFVSAVSLSFILLYAIIWDGVDTLRTPRTRTESLDIIPNDKAKAVIFEEHPEFKNFTHEMDSHWDDLVPTNGGFLLQVGKDKHAHANGISMFHQLHCLSMIRTAVQTARHEDEKPSSRMDTTLQNKYIQQQPRDATRGISKHELEEDQSASSRDAEHRRTGGLDEENLLQCFDYLRQTILCNADGTVEPWKKDNTGMEYVDGMSERQCRDWTRLWDASVHSYERLEQLTLNTDGEGNL